MTESMPVLTGRSSYCDVIVLPNITMNAVKSFQTLVRQHMSCDSTDYVGKRDKWLQKFESGLGELFVFSLFQFLDCDFSTAVDIVSQISQREALGSTGVARGIAVPHSRHPNVKSSKACFIRLADGGFDFDSLDGEPVTLFALYICQVDRFGDGLRISDGISRVLRGIDQPYETELLTQHIDQRFPLLEGFTKTSFSWDRIDVTRSDNPMDRRG